jgi:hypothetical protein
LLSSDLIKDRAKRSGIGDICAITPNLAAQRLKLGRALDGAGRIRTAPTQQSDRAGAMFGQPTRRLETEARDPAGNQPRIYDLT